MNSAPRTPQEDDVGRLFKQLDLDAFSFRSFNRSGSDPVDSDGSEFQSSAEPVAEASAVPKPTAPTSPTSPTMVLPPAAPVSLPPMVAARAVSPVDVAFSRLLRINDERSSNLPGFRMTLPRPPRLVDLPSTNGHELRISDVLNRLYRLGGSKMSLIRQRGDA